MLKLRADLLRAGRSASCFEGKFLNILMTKKITSLETVGGLLRCNDGSLSLEIQLPRCMTEENVLHWGLLFLLLSFSISIDCCSVNFWRFTDLDLSVLYVLRCSMKILYVKEYFLNGWKLWHTWWQRPFNVYLLMRVLQMKQSDLSRLPPKYLRVVHKCRLHSFCYQAI